MLLLRKKYFKVVHEKSKIRKAMIKVNIRVSFEGDFQIKFSEKLTICRSWKSQKEAIRKKIVLNGLNFISTNKCLKRVMS